MHTAAKKWKSVGNGPRRLLSTVAHPCQQRFQMTKLLTASRLQSTSHFLNDNDSHGSCNLSN